MPSCLHEPEFVWCAPCGANCHIFFDEIKLAFKKHALQVHPDKGGSKEAFHLVYQALETLSDPQNYDQALAGSQPRQRMKRACPKKTSQKPQKSGKSGKKPKAHGSHATHRPAPVPQCKQTKLLMKICELLKQLPRAVRNDVITKQFSQKQRLILEKWMVENSQTESGRQERSPALSDNVVVQREKTRGTSLMQNLTGSLPWLHLSRWSKWGGHCDPKGLETRRLKQSQRYEKLEVELWPTDQVLPPTGQASNLMPSGSTLGHTIWKLRWNTWWFWPPQGRKCWKRKVHMQRTLSRNDSKQHWQYLPMSSEKMLKTSTCVSVLFNQLGLFLESSHSHLLWSAASEH